MSGLPSGWATASLNEVCCLLTDGTHHSPANLATGDFKYVTAKNIRPWGLDLTDITYVEADTHFAIYKRAPVRKGDVLYIKDGATTGLAVTNPSDEPFSLLSSVALLRPEKEFLDNDFLKHWLNCPTTFETMIGRMSGSAIRRLTLTTIGSQEIGIPPLPEQRRIVAKLDALDARAKRARADLDRIPALVARAKQAILAKAFRGELTADWRAAHAETPSPILAAVRELRQGSPRLSRRQKLAKIPDFLVPQSWIWISPDEVAADERYSIGIGPFGSNLVKSDYREAGVRLVFVRDIRREVFGADDARFVDHAKASELHQHLARPGDVLITKMGDPPGDCCVFPLDAEPAIITADCIKLTPHVDLAESKYLNYCIRSEQVQSQFKGITAGVAQQKVSLERFRQLALPIAPLAEQAEIVRRIESAFAKIDRIAADAASASKLLGRLDQAILTKAFRGELVPQNPEDEPTSILLERIRATTRTAPRKGRGRKA